MAVRHRRDDLQGLEVWALVASAGATITRASGVNFQDADITSARNATGDYTITLNPLKGPKGEVFIQTTALSATLKLFTVIKSAAYTNDSLAVNVLIFDDTGAAQEAAVMLHIYAE